MITFIFLSIFFPGHLDFHVDIFKNGTKLYPTVLLFWITTEHHLEIIIAVSQNIPSKLDI